MQCLLLILFQMAKWNCLTLHNQFCFIVTFLGLPTIIGNIFSFMVFLGVLLQLSAWVTGPSKQLFKLLVMAYCHQNLVSIAKINMAFLVTLC